MEPAGANAYAGDISPATAYSVLCDHPDAVLVDVRTAAEWRYVGTVDLSELGKGPLCVEWTGYPHAVPNPSFLDDLRRLFDEAVDGDALDGVTAMMMCRSGVRSAAAGKAAAETLAWRRPVTFWNIAGGFEGDLDGDGRRGKVNGWKADGLPWRQS